MIFGEEEEEVLGREIKKIHMEGQKRKPPH
jgi:hypothetical protein